MSASLRQILLKVFPALARLRAKNRNLSRLRVYIVDSFCSAFAVNHFQAPVLPELILSKSRQAEVGKPLAQAFTFRMTAIIYHCAKISHILVGVNSYKPTVPFVDSDLRQRSF